MATVFLARLGGAGGFQRFVAIKRLHPHLAREHEFIEMFLDEARLAARLHHPHVVPILEIGESSDGYYLVMEYVEGDTLARLMARSALATRPMPPGVAVRVGLDTLAGLHAAHELLDDEGKPLEIVHRDVSPQNILIGVDGSSRITDFGVARAASRLSTTRTGQLKGKLSYMAPEQARGKTCDRRADLFAMGIVMWETLAKKRLFRGENEGETLNRVLYEPVPLLRDANPEVHPALDAVVMKALERDPDARYATCAEMADALEAAANVADTMGERRDVSTHLEAVIGTDILQQREAVRAWLSRSEPSKSGAARSDSSRRKIVEPVREPESATKIVVAPSTADLGKNASESSLSSTTLAVSDAQAASPFAPSPDASGVLRPDESGQLLAARARSREGWIVAAALMAILVGGLAFLKLRPSVVTSTRSTPSVGSVGSADVAARPSASAVDTPVPSSATPSASASGVATATSPTTSTSAGLGPTTSSIGVKPVPKIPRLPVRPVGPRPSATAPAPTASGPTLPDDLSHNPYR